MMNNRILQLMFLTVLSTQVIAAENADNLFDLSLEELMKITVTTVEKSPQSFIDTPRALYVITQEDIRRSGATSIPEALRMVPGVHVAQITAHRWAISIRGFQQEFAGKLLVLLDGRTLYTPTFSGVHWDSNDVVLDQVERIEVLRGPGSVVWGSNAMNGVINIITKKAADTQGGKLNVAAGNEANILTDVTYGNHTGNWYWRAYAKYLNWKATSRNDYTAPGLPGHSINDAWNVGRYGVRADQEAGSRTVSLSANVYNGDINDLLDDVPALNPARYTYSYYAGITSGYDATVNWTQKFNPSNEWQFRFFVDESDRKDANVSEQRSTYDVEAQNRLKQDNHIIVYGAGYRRYGSRTQPHIAVKFVPNDEAYNLVNAFFHDDWHLNQNWRLNYGLKVEDDKYTNTSYQPAIGLSWQKNQSLVWMNVERAIRLTNRLERDIRANLEPIPANTYYAGQPEGYIQLTGQPDNKEESIIAYELGFRRLINNGFYWDVATYYFKYHNLIFFESQQNIGAPFINADGQYIIPVLISNTGKGDVTGLEMSFTWQAMTSWVLKSSFTYTMMNLDGDPIVTKIEGQTPRKQFNVRSFYNINKQWQFDSAIYYVDKLPGFLATFNDYLRLDLRLGWKSSPHSELSLDGQNLLDKSHLEHNEKGYSTYSAVPRSYYLKWSYKF